MLSLGKEEEGSADERIASIKLDRAKDVRYELVTHAQEERVDLLVTGAERLNTFMARLLAPANTSSSSSKQG